MGSIDPELDRYINRYGGNRSRAIEGLAQDRWWARFIYAHDYIPGWLDWAKRVLDADPDWTSGRNRSCDCTWYRDEHRQNLIGRALE